MAPGVAALLILLTWSAALVRAVSRGAWFLAAGTATPAVLATIVAAQAIGGRWPVFYGVLLAVSLFIAGAMVVMGGLAGILRLLAGSDRR